ncbi:MAG: hypothetical protein ACT4OD_02165 [Candidatus Nitrosotenuis sp.]
MFVFSLIKKNSIEELDGQLEFLINDLNQITKQLEILEIKKITSNSNDKESYYEDAQFLIQKQNVISFEILKIRKQIKKMRNKFLLKIELALLPCLALLLILSMIF